MPRLVRDIVERAFCAEPEMCVEVAPELADLRPAAERSRPDYVIVGMHDGGLPGEAEALFRERARPRVLGITPRDGHVELFELRPERVTLGQCAPSEVVAAVRAAAERP